MPAAEARGANQGAHPYIGRAPRAPRPPGGGWISARRHVVLREPDSLKSKPLRADLQARGGEVVENQPVQAMVDMRPEPVNDALGQESRGIGVPGATRMISDRGRDVALQQRALTDPRVGRALRSTGRPREGPIS